MIPGGQAILMENINLFKDSKIISVVIKMVLNSVVLHVHHIITEVFIVFKFIATIIYADLDDNFCVFLDETYVDYMNMDEESHQDVEISPNFSFSSNLEGAWILGDSNVSFPFCLQVVSSKQVNEFLGNKCLVKDKDSTMRKQHQWVADDTDSEYQIG
jgi:hypothetical protein